MEHLEDFMNWVTDMDWGWWPVVALRPAKDADIDNKVLLKISPVFGPFAGILGFIILVMRGMVFFSLIRLVAYMVVGTAIFFVVYKFTFAYFWNRRARRLRSARFINIPSLPGLHALEAQKSSAPADRAPKPASSQEPANPDVVPQ